MRCCGCSAAPDTPSPSVGSTPASGRSPSASPADDEGLDGVPAVAVGVIRDALFERAEEIGEEAGDEIVALARERALEERPTPGEHAAHVFPREDGGVLVPVGIVETEELGALELEPGDPAAGRLEG